MEAATLPCMEHLTAADFEHVYEPAEDTYLLLDCIQHELPALSARKPKLAVEIGCVRWLAQVLCAGLTLQTQGGQRVCQRFCGNTLAAHGNHLHRLECACLQRHLANVAGQQCAQRNFACTIRAALTSCEQCARADVVRCDLLSGMTERLRVRLRGVAVLPLPSLPFHATMHTLE